MRFQELLQSENENLRLRADLLTETHITRWLKKHIAVPPYVNVSTLKREACACLDLSESPRKDLLDYRAVFTISIDGANESARTRLVELFGPTTSSAQQGQSTLFDWQPAAREWPFVTVHFVTEALNYHKNGVFEFDECSVRDCLAYHFPNSNFDELLTWHLSDLIPLDNDHDLAPGLAEILYRQSLQPPKTVSDLPPEMNM